jgi:hypothetical protein
VPPHLDRKQRWLWSAIRIRCALRADEPRLIPHYLAEGLALARRARLSPWEAAWRSTELLANTAADRALPAHWRQLCLDHVHQPLAQLARCTFTPQQQLRLARMRWRIATLDLSSDIALDGPDTPIA